MELRKAEASDYKWVRHVIGRKHLDYCTIDHIREDYICQRLYVVVADNGNVLAILSLKEESDYNYTAVKRLCILNKKNQGKGIARFALQEIQKEVKGRIGATPWCDNDRMRHLLETIGFKHEYTFNDRWCFYAKDCN